MSEAPRDDVPTNVLMSMEDVILAARVALTADNYREVMFQLDRLRERCSWVEKMMWHRLNPYGHETADE